MIGRALLIAASLIAGEAWACSCDVPPLASMLDQAEYVAVVRIRGVSLDPEWNPGAEDQRARQPLRLEFDVVEALRGEIPPDAMLVDSFPAWGCSLGAVPGDDVLVVATPADDRVELHRCSASRVLGQHSLYAGGPRPARLNGDEASYLAGVRAYVQHGESLHECVRNEFPPQGPEDAVARAERCQDHFRRASEFEVR